MTNTEKKYNAIKEMTNIIDSFGPKQTKIFDKHKRESFKRTLEISKKELEKNTDELLISFFKKEIEYLELCIKERE